MTTRVAINGLGRIGRVILKLVVDEATLEVTKVIDGDLVKVMCWYDNEWGYANQMIREAISLTGGPTGPAA